MMLPSLGDLTGLRIAHLIESDGPGGAETVVAELASTLQHAGAQNVLIMASGGEGWLARQLEGSGVAIEYIQHHRPISPARSLEAIFRRHRVAVAHSHEFSMAVYGAWASWRAGIPHVITMHGGRYYAGRLRRRLALRAAIALSERTLAVSSSVARQLSRELRVPSARIATLPNGVRRMPAGQATLRDELRLGPDDRLLVSVGSLYPVKGHVHLIEAFAVLATRHAGLHLAIVGRGEMAGALSVLARDRGCAARVHLIGLRSDVAAILTEADVFVLPSLSEGLPLALLEAMSAACPIVASDVGEVGVALAQGEAGILVEPGDPAALTAAIDSLLSDPVQARALGARAAQRAAAEYDVSQMVRRYVGVYEELLASRESSDTSLLRAAR